MTSRRRWTPRMTTCRSDLRQSFHAAALGAILAAAACVVPARAQSPTDRLLLDQLRRDLAQVSQPEAALALGRTPPAGVSTALRALWRGFVAVRVGELTRDRRSYDEAILRFDEATRRAPAWPYSWFGLAVSKLALSRLDALTRPSLHQPDGVSYYLGFTQAIGETFSRDSLFPPAMAVLRASSAFRASANSRTSSCARLPGRHGSLRPSRSNSSSWRGPCGGGSGSIPRSRCSMPFRNAAAIRAWPRSSGHTPLRCSTRCRRPLRRGGEASITRVR
jgi:hypothetical protein